MEFIEKIAQFGLPVVLGLVVIVAVIAMSDRHPRKKARHHLPRSNGSHGGDTDTS